MFLSLLNTEQKKLFLSLAYNLAMSDGNFCENERVVMKRYSMEMNMEMNMEDVDKDINRVLSGISDISGVREKKIIIFELVGLAMADYNFDKGEREIVQKALATFGLNHEFGVFCEKKLTEYFNLQEELNAKILS